MRLVFPTLWTLQAQRLVTLTKTTRCCTRRCSRVNIRRIWQVAIFVALTTSFGRGTSSSSSHSRYSSRSSYSNRKVMEGRERNKLCWQGSSLKEMLRVINQPWGLRGHKKRDHLAMVVTSEKVTVDSPNN